MTDHGTAQPIDLIAAVAGSAALADSGFSQARLSAAIESLCAQRGIAGFRVEEVRLGSTAAPTGDGAAISFVFSLGSEAAAASVGLSAGLFEAMFERFYGGEGEHGTTMSAPTAAQRRFTRRLGTDLASVVGAAWPDTAAVSPTFQSSHFAGDEPATAQPCGPIAFVQLAIANSSPITLHVAVDAIAALQDRRRPAPSARPAIDGDWRMRLMDRAAHVRLPVRSVLARPEISAARLLTLKTGDVLPFAMPATVPVTVARRMFAHATLGEAQGAVAVRIETIAKGSDA